VIRVRTLAEAEAHIASLTVRVEELERLVADHAQRFDTLQSPWWKRAAFRLNGWPGIRDLNGTQKRRPWHRRR